MLETVIPLKDSCTFENWTGETIMEKGIICSKNGMKGLFLSLILINVDKPNNTFSISIKTG